MRQHLTIPSGLIGELERHAEAEAPREACGLLSGDLGSGVARHFRPARNVAESAYLYRMDPGEVVRLVDAIAVGGEGLLAIVHSHPTSPAVPSPTDVRDAAWPGVRHVIVSLDGSVVPPDRVRAWSIRGGVATEVRLEVG